MPPTFDLLDTAEGVFQGVERAGLALAPFLGGQVHLQLLDGLEQLFLRLGLGRLFAAARGTHGHSRVRGAGGTETQRDDSHESRGRGKGSPHGYQQYIGCGV